MNNKLLFDYGPVWSKKCHDNHYIASRDFPPPDCVTCGQMVTQDFFSRNEREDISMSETTKEEEPIVKTRKYTSKKFPLNFDTCAIPLLNQPHFEHQLPGNLDERYLNILSSYELNNVNHIVYGEWDEESFALKISSLNELDDENKGEIVLGNSQFISEYNVLHNVQADVINGIPYVLLIVDNTVSLLRVKEEGFNLCCVESKDTISACLNKDLNNRLAFTKEASINLFDIEREKVMWYCHLSKDKYKTKQYGQCEFGSNPFHICVSCKSEIILADTRTEENQTRKLFDTKKFHTYLYSDNEIISSFKHTQDSSLFYVACSDTLLLMDERYCKYPVLNWYHMIKGRPSYMQCFKRNNIEFVLMADSDKSQLCFTSLQTDDSEYPEVCSLSTPMHKNIVKDTILFAKDNGIALGDLTEKEICSPLVGLSILPFSFGHTVIFQNNYGNLFYFNCYDRKNKYNFKNKERGLKHLGTFEKLVENKTRKDHLKKCTNGKYLDGLKYKRCFTSFNETIKVENSDKLIWDISSFNNFGSYSKFFSKNDINQRDNSDLSFFSEKDRDNLSAEYIKNCSDSFSQKILSEWSSDFSDFSSLDTPKYESNTSNLFRYKSCPYFLDTESYIDIPLFRKSELDPGSDNTSDTDEDSDEIPVARAVKSKFEPPTDKFSNKSSSKNDLEDSDNVSNSSTINNNRKSVCLSETKKSKRKSKTDGF